MKNKLKWIGKWFFLPYRLIYLLIYFGLSKLFKVRNEKFRLFYHKKEKVIYSGWEEFYDADTFCKECIMSFTEPLLLLVLIILHLLITTWLTGAIIIYGWLYIIFKFDFYVTLKYVRNYKKNKLIREYVGPDLYYYAKFNYQDLTLIFPELLNIDKTGKLPNCPTHAQKTLEMCKELWKASKTNKIFTFI